MSDIEERLAEIEYNCREYEHLETFLNTPSVLWLIETVREQYNRAEHAEAAALGLQDRCDAIAPNPVVTIERIANGFIVTDPEGTRYAATSDSNDEYEALVAALWEVAEALEVFNSKHAPSRFNITYEKNRKPDQSKPPIINGCP